MKMDAIILAGGYGTRLRPFTLDCPKPLLPIANRVFLEILFFRLKQAGVGNVALSVFHQADVFRKKLKKLDKQGLKVQVIEEKKPLGTGGAVRYAWSGRKNTCLILNGDILTDFDFREIIRYHKKMKSQATLWVRDVQDPSSFGVIESDRNRNILHFLEKPAPGTTKSKSINAGLYVFEPEIFSEIPFNQVCSIERETFPLLLNKKYNLKSYRAIKNPYWNDIGRPESYLEGSMDVLGRKLEMGMVFRRLWSGLTTKGMLDKTSVIDSKAFVQRSVLGARCRIGVDSMIKDSVLFSGCRIGRQVSIEGALIGEDCWIGNHVKILPGTVLGPKSRISDYSIVGGGNG